MLDTMVAAQRMPREMHISNQIFTKVAAGDHYSLNFARFSLYFLLVKLW